MMRESKGENKYLGKMEATLTRTADLEAEAFVPYVAPRPRAFSIEEYIRLRNAEVLPEESRTELILGQIVDMSPISDPHAGCIRMLTYDLNQNVAKRYTVSAEQPVRLNSTTSMLQPDLAILKYRRDFYSSLTPTETDILLIGEVSLSSLQYDRETKAPIYAAAGIAEYWIFNLKDRQLEVHTGPRPTKGYSKVEFFDEEAIIEHPLFGSVRVDDLLPAAGYKTEIDPT